MHDSFRSDELFFSSTVEEVVEKFVLMLDEGNGWEYVLLESKTDNICLIWPPFPSFNLSSFEVLPVETFLKAEHIIGKVW
jgi:hypothetical protein